MILPVEGYPVSTDAIRAWFRRTYGREASELELGEIQDRLLRRDSTEVTQEPPAETKRPG
ncbi:MAG: hypothetical protein ACREF3_20240 [Acetobacteraceae bacterium]